MAVCRKRSTNNAPLALSISYFTGRPPAGISIRTFTSFGGLRPAGICKRSIIVLSNRQEDFADVFAGLHQMMGSLCFGEREGLCHDGFDLASFNQRPDVMSHGVA